MAKTYRVGPGARAVNAVFRWLARWGLGQSYLHVLTVTGRTSGLPRSTPIDMIEVAGEHYLVAPYGPVNWVRNLRAAPQATLQRGKHVHTYDATELPPAEAAPVIREYVRLVPVTKAYWDIDEDSTDDEVLTEAKGHPVFRLRAT